MNALARRTRIDPLDTWDMRQDLKGLNARIVDARHWLLFESRSASAREAANARAQLSEDEENARTIEAALLDLGIITDYPLVFDDREEENYV